MYTRVDPVLLKHIDRMRKWVEEDMTIESANTIEIGGNEQEVSHDDNTWNEYFDTIVILCGCYK